MAGFWFCAVRKKQMAQYPLLGADAQTAFIFGTLPLTQLLRYVYTRYPEYTTASEIVAKVLGKPAPKLTD